MMLSDCSTVEAVSYGLYQLENPTEDLLSRMVLSLSPIDFIAHWQRCSATANMIAEFQAFNFSNRKKVGNILSTIVNELIENAIKFTRDPHLEIQMKVCNYADFISFEIQNTCSKKQRALYESFFSTLLAKNPEEYFLETILEHAEGNKSESQLGLITLVKDFNAKIGVKFISEKKYDIVYTQLRLDTEELQNL